MELPLDSRVTSIAVRRVGEGPPIVPYGRHAERVLVLTETEAERWSLADLDAADLTWYLDLNLAAEPRDRITSSIADQGRSVDAGMVEDVRLRGALVRALQLSGALDQSVELATAHAAVREQFGRPLLKFQAVQALLADAAAETALAQAATLGAVIAMNESGDAEERWRSVAVAKSCTSHAAGVVCRNAHQVIGAIGFTTEHALHRYTGRLLAWRDEFGTRDEWDRALLEAVTTSVDRDVWSYVVGR
jgi:acyl-CoA dehydrogenase